MTDISLARQIDGICERFEAAWLAGEQPRIEAFVEQRGSTDRTRLLGELLRLEAGLRHDSGESVSAEQYVTRFPHDTGTIAAALHDVLGDPSVGNGPGRYVLLEEIGRGGMGAVYRATDRQLGRRVAVKVLLPDYRHVPEAVRRLEEESKICGGLQHPGVPPVHELGQLSDGRPFLAMKLVEGITLAEKLAQRPDPNHELTHWLGVFEQVCQTVAYAHAQGLIHRDLKPANVMVGAFGEIQIMDWGLAKRLRNAECGMRIEKRVHPNLENQDQQITQAGDLLGTPAYMSPEQARGLTDGVDQRTDVFALGSMLCEILTGAPAYAGDSPDESVDAARRADLSDASRRVDGCRAHEELVQLCHDCLAPNPDDRPRAATEVSQRISVYLEGVAERLQQAELAQARAEVARAARRRRRRLWIGSACVVLLLLVAIATGSLLAAAHFRRMEADQRTLAESNASLAKDNEEKRQAAETARAAAEQSNRQARQTLADMYCGQGQLLEDEDQVNLAALWFCEAARVAEGYDGRRRRMNGIRALNALTMCPQPTAMLDRAPHRPDRLIFHPNNRWLIIKPQSKFHPDVLWDLRSEQLHPFPAELGKVMALAWNPSGDRLAAGTEEGRILIFDFPTWDLIATVDPNAEQPMPVRELEYSPSGKYLAAAGRQQFCITTTADISSSSICLREKNDILGVVFSPDDRHLVTLGADNTCRAYGLADENERPTEVPHTADKNLGWRICRPTFDSRGRLVTIEKELSWMNLDTGAEQHTAVPAGPLTFQLLEVPGRDAICVMNHEGAFLCRPDSPAEKLEPASILSAVTRPDTGKLILGGALSGLRQLAAGADELRPYPIFTPARVLTMGISTDGEFLATSSYSHQITVWKMPAATPFHTNIPADASWSVGLPRSDSQRPATKGTGVFSQNGPVRASQMQKRPPSPFSRSQRILVVRKGRDAQVYLLENGTSEGPPLVPDGVLSEAGWSGDEQSVVTVSDRTDPAPAAVIDLWDWRSGQRKQPSIEIPVEPLVDSQPPLLPLARLAIRPAGDRIAFAARDGGVIVASLADPARWHAVEGRDLESVYAGTEFDGLVLAIGRVPTTLRRVDWSRPAAIATLDKPRIRSAFYAADCGLLGLGLEDGVMLAAAESLEPVGDPYPHPSLSFVLAMSDDGRRIATTCSDGYLRVWNTRTRTLTCPPIRYWHQQLQLTPDGSLLIAPAKDHACRVIDVETGLRICPEFSLNSNPSHVSVGSPYRSVTPDGRFIIIGGTAGVSLIDRHHVLPEPPADLDRFKAWCEVVSGHQFEHGELVPLTRDQLHERWQGYDALSFVP